MSKIVHIMLAGPVTDGWTYQDNMITKYHRKLGYQVTMITSKWVWGTNGKLEKINRNDYINEDNVHVIRLELSGRDYFQKKYKKYIGLSETLDKEKPDILFIHNVSFGDVDKVIAYIQRHPQIKVYVDNHSDFSNSGTNWFSKNILHKIIWRKNARKLEPYVSKFYGVLPSRVDWLIEIYGLPAAKCELLVMGGDDEEICKADDTNKVQMLRHSYKIKKDDFLIVTGGKIDSAKKQTLLLMEAVAKMENPKIRLIVFGSVEDEIKNQVKNLSDGNKVQYIGWIKAVDSYRYFAAADLVVFPGRHSVFWEQVVGQGIPLVCKYWEGTTHVNVCNNAFFLYDDSVNEILRVIKYVLDNYKDILQNAKCAQSTFLYSDIAKHSIEMR